MATKHSNAAPASQRLCNEFLARLRSIRSDVQREEKKSVCGFLCKGHYRFAYFFHSAKANRVYLRATGTTNLPPEYGALGIHTRPETKSGWAEAYPLFWDVSEVDLDAFAGALVTNAVPLSIKGKKSTREEKLPPFVLPHELQADAYYEEGSAQQIVVNTYERDPKARAACLAHFGTVCAVCGFDFGKTFGPEFAGVIEVHHLKPLASIGKRYRVNPRTDLRPICPNCHTAIHRRDPPYEIDELKALLRVAR